MVILKASENRSALVSRQELLSEVMPAMLGRRMPDTSKGRPAAVTVQLNLKSEVVCHKA